MRSACALLLLAAVAAPGERLAPRRGAGWTGFPKGMREIEEWMGKSPKVPVSRDELRYDPDGHTVRSIRKLDSLELHALRVGKRTIKCRKYKTWREVGPGEERGTAFVSYRVPGGLVRAKTKLFDGKGRLIETATTEAVDFGTR